jgi:Ion channel
MLRQIALGGGVSVVNISIHALIMVAIVRGGRRLVTSRRSWPVHLPVPHLIAVMIAAVSVLMAAHFAEIAVWSLAYGWAGVAPADADALYFAFVNYTTLGYGDVVPTEGWRLIGPITAMNGVLLFGWSTAVIFEVLRITIRGERHD